MWLVGHIHLIELMNFSIEGIRNVLSLCLKHCTKQDTKVVVVLPPKKMIIIPGISTISSVHSTPTLLMSNMIWNHASMSIYSVSLYHHRHLLILFLIPILFDIAHSGYQALPSLLRLHTNSHHSVLDSGQPFNPRV